MGKETNVLDNNDEKLEIITESPSDDKVILDVVDDVPIADKGRKPLGKDALAEDDEKPEYSEKIKKRMGELRHQAHDERRAKEAALRERDEALNLARQYLANKADLEKQLTYGEASYAVDVVKKAEYAIDAAKAKQRRAYEAGDPDAVAEATVDLARAAQEHGDAVNWSQRAQQKVNISLQNQKEGVQSNPTTHQPTQPRAPKPDPRANEWTARNAWFGSDSVMTSLAYGVHEKLVRDGVHPIEDADNYYSEIDAAMRRHFPEYEWPESDDRESAAPPAPKKSTTPPVAPVTRTAPSSKNRIVLTATEVRIAEKLGIPLEQYAREKLKLQGDR